MFFKMLYSFFNRINDSITFLILWNDIHTLWFSYSIVFKSEYLKEFSLVIVCDDFELGWVLYIFETIILKTVEIHFPLYSHQKVLVSHTAFFNF